MATTISSVATTAVTTVKNAITTVKPITDFVVKHIVLILFIGVVIYAGIETYRYRHVMSVLDTAVRSTDADKLSFTTTIGRLALENQASNDALTASQAGLAELKATIGRIQQTGTNISTASNTASTESGHSADAIGQAINLLQ